MSSKSTQDAIHELITGLISGSKGNGQEKEMLGLQVDSSDETAVIIIPSSMTKLQAARELELQDNEENTKQENTILFDGWQYQDVLIAIKRVSERMFGWLKAKPKTDAPVIVEITTNVVDGKPVTEKGFLGEFLITAWEDATVTVSFNGPNIRLWVEAKKKYDKKVTEFFSALKEHLLTDSIFKGKTVVVTKSRQGVDFQIIENKPSDKIVLNTDTQLVVDQLVIPSLKEKGKSISLFTGQYGTGKTETAMHMGNEAIRNGMSFFYIKDSSVFSDFLALTANYQPCLVFLEDVDSIGSGERDKILNDLLNTLDGVQSKGNNLKVIFTTNHPEHINHAFRRPGRIDLMLEFPFPDKEAVSKIYQVYLGHHKGWNSVDVEKITYETPIVQGAVIAEICKRANKMAVQSGRITTENILAAIYSMSYQIRMMEAPPAEAPLAERFLAINKEAIREHLSDIVG